MSEGGEARNHEAEREAVAKALAFEDAGNPEMWDWQGADAALAALNALRRSPQVEAAARRVLADHEITDLEDGGRVLVDALALAELRDAVRRSPQPQRQDSLSDQMQTIEEFATQAGCYDAVDWMRKAWAARALRSPEGEDHEHRCRYELDAEGDLACPVCGRYADDGDEAADAQDEDHEAACADHPAVTARVRVDGKWRCAHPDHQAPERNTEKLVEALRELRRTADIYQATVRPVVWADTPDARMAFDRGKTLQDRLLKAIGVAHEALAEYSSTTKEQG